MSPAMLYALLPDLIISVGGMLVLLLGVWSREESSWVTRRVTWAATLVALAGAAAAAWVANRDFGEVSSGAIAVDPFRWAIVAVILLATLGTLVLALDYNDGAGLVAPEPPALVLFAASGMMLMAAARDLILLFLGIEIMSIAIYVLTGLDRRRPAAAEASLKYFLLGAFSTGFLLYGIALLYGATGTTSLAEMGRVIAEQQLGKSPMLLAGMALLFTGFAFKVAAVPFHMWTPDVYEGAPTPYTAFMAAGVKVAAFAGLARVALEALGPAYPQWHYAAWVLAAATMVVGNVLALVQQNVKRMLAYSSIAHAGYLLVAIVSGSADGSAAIIFYALAYTLATFGAFAVLTIVSGGSEKHTTLADLSGLASQRPWLAAAMAIFMFALLGFPIAGGMGFFAKWFVVKAALGASAPQTRIAVVLVLASVVSAGYYLGVIRTMFMQPMREDTPRVASAPQFASAVIAVCAILLLVLGIYPTPAVRWARASVLVGAPGAQATPATTALTP
jgi:NADH-quinone oxidoreductase subunit N